MTESTLMERALSLALDNPEPPTALPASPAISESTQAALRKCRAAWQRAFNACLRDCEGEPDSVDRALAAKEAGKAYSGAMPLLAGPDGIRDFIACAAHGILIGAIPPDRSGQVLYAAQIALSLLAAHPRIR